MHYQQGDKNVRFLDLFKSDIKQTSIAVTAPAISVEFLLMVQVLYTEIKSNYQGMYLSIDKYPVFEISKENVCCQVLL